MLNNFDFFRSRHLREFSRCQHLTPVFCCKAQFQPKRLNSVMAALIWRRNGGVCNGRQIRGEGRIESHSSRQLAVGGRWLEAANDVCTMHDGGGGAQRVFGLYFVVNQSTLSRLPRESSMTLNYGHCQQPVYTTIWSTLRLSDVEILMTGIKHTTQELHCFSAVSISHKRMLTEACHAEKSAWTNNELLISIISTRKAQSRATKHNNTIKIMIERKRTCIYTFDGAFPTLNRNQLY